MSKVSPERLFEYTARPRQHGSTPFDTAAIYAERTDSYGTVGRLAALMILSSRTRPPEMRLPEAESVAGKVGFLVVHTPFLSFVRAAHRGPSQRSRPAGYDESSSHMDDAARIWSVRACCPSVARSRRSCWTRAGEVSAPPPGNLVSALIAPETKRDRARLPALLDTLVGLLRLQDDEELTDAFSAWAEKENP